MRGMLVRLTDSWQELLARREKASDAFPAPVRTLLGEMAAAGALMQSNIKFNGALVLQVFGDGPVRLAVVEVQPGSGLPRHRQGGRRGRCVGAARGHGQPARQRAAARSRWIRRTSAPASSPTRAWCRSTATSASRCSSSQVLEHYVLQSEQLDTRLVLAADDRIAAGLLIQRLPVEGAGNLAGCATKIASGLTSIQPASPTSPRRSRARNCWRWTPTPSCAACSGKKTCAASSRSPARAGRAALQLLARTRGRHAAQPGPRGDRGILAEQGQVEIGCDFCGIKYHFDPVDSRACSCPPAANRQAAARSTEPRCCYCRKRRASSALMRVHPRRRRARPWRIRGARRSRA